MASALGQQTELLLMTPVPHTMMLVQILATSLTIVFRANVAEKQRLVSSTLEFLQLSRRLEFELQAPGFNLTHTQSLLPFGEESANGGHLFLSQSLCYSN